MQSSPNKRLSYRSDIDGLRAVAVLSVFAFHVSPGRIKGGFVGVDIFFVISGFLISSIIYNELESGTFSVFEFYVRRIRRIYPALFVILAFVCVAGWILLLPSDFARLGEQVAGGSAFVANFVLWSQAGYFTPDAAQEPLVHLWSLGVEEQYYLIFPLICMLFYRAKSRWTLPAAFLAIATISMVLNVSLVSKHSAATYFLPFSRLWELFVGAGLSLCMQRNLQTAWESRFLAKWRTAIGLLGLAMIVLSVFIIDKFDPFPGWYALLPTIGAALVIAAGESAWVNHYILSWKPAVFIGLISYPLYLWHWPILAFWNVANDSWGVPRSHLLKGALIALAFVLAYLTYHFIELPIRQVKQRAQRRKGALWLLGCVSITGAFGVAIILAKGFPARVPSAVVALDHDFEAEAGKQPEVGRHCFLDPDESAASFTSNCVDPAEGHPGQPLVLVWGDSHAGDLLFGFRSLQPQSGVRLAQYTASLCTPVIGLQLRERPACLSINNAVINRVMFLKPDIVVLSAVWDFYFDHDPSGEKLLQTIASLKAAGVRRVVVIGSAPIWTSDVPALLVSELRRSPNSPMPHRLSRKLLEPFDDSRIIAIANKAGAVYVPLIDSLCDQTSCIATTGPGWEDVVTMDDAHFTEHGSVYVAQRIWGSIVY